MKEVKIGYIYVPIHVPYVPSKRENKTNTIVETRKFTEEEQIFDNIFSITIFIILISIVIYVFYKFLYKN